MRVLGQWLANLLDVIAPSGCAACDAATSGTFCSACGLPASVAAQSFEGVPLIVAGAYDAPLSTAIVRFKYEGRAELARGLAKLLARHLAELPLPRGSVLVPVPLHARRLAERGYNQAALLAQELAASAGLACEPRLLRRVRETERQVGKLRAARLTNARGAFELQGRPVTHAVLVDDVVTTGSTVRACAQALASGGVQLSAVLALAQARPG